MGTAISKSANESAEWPTSFDTVVRQHLVVNEQLEEKFIIYVIT